VLKLTDQHVGGYERVVRATNDTTGLDACISIHNTQLGPAIGGCRYMEYNDFEEQRYDALRLSKHMTYKNALAGLHNGGGKTTINTRAYSGANSCDLWKSFAEALEKLDGIYYTAGDIGTTTQDLKEIRRHTQYVLGYEGDDSGWATAYGVYNSLCGAYKFFRNKPVIEFNKYLLNKRSIGIVGLGKVGERLVKFLTDNDCQRSLTIYVYDIHKEKYDKVKKDVISRNEQWQLGGISNRLQWCDSIEEINQLPVDVYAPCATGGMITENFANVCHAKIICGGANNQLENNDVAQILFDRGILYVPDYLANSGGVVQVRSSYDISHDITTSLNVAWDNPLVKDRLEDLDLRAYEILEQSQEQNKPTNIVAKEIVENKLKGL